MSLLLSGDGQRDDWHVECSIISAQDGSYAAIGQLFDLYRDYLLRVANEELQTDLVPKVAASDLVQETFLQAARDFRKFVRHQRRRVKGMVAADPDPQFAGHPAPLLPDAKACRRRSRYRWLAAVSSAIGRLELASSAPSPSECVVTPSSASWSMLPCAGCQPSTPRSSNCERLPASRSTWLEMRWDGRAKRCAKCGSGQLNDWPMSSRSMKATDNDPIDNEVFINRVIAYQERLDVGDTDGHRSDRGRTSRPLADEVASRAMGSPASCPAMHRGVGGCWRRTLDGSTNAARAAVANRWHASEGSWPVRDSR